MKYAIVESGGKQYKAVEGETIEVDRLQVKAGAHVDLDRILMVVDGKTITIGTPTVSGFQVRTTVLDHVKGPKVIFFRYRPKKRIRVKAGHRQQYSRLMIDHVGKPGEAKKETRAEPVKAAPARQRAKQKVQKVVTPKAAAAATPAPASARKKAAGESRTTGSTPVKKPTAVKTTKPAASKTTKPAASKTSTKTAATSRSKTPAASSKSRPAAAKPAVKKNTSKGK